MTTKNIFKKFKIDNLFIFDTGLVLIFGHVNYSLKKITSKFHAIISKNEGGVNFFMAKFFVFRKSRLKFARVV